MTDTDLLAIACAEEETPDEQGAAWATANPFGDIGAANPYHVFLDEEPWGQWADGALSVRREQWADGALSVRREQWLVSR